MAELLTRPFEVWGPQIPAHRIPPPHRSTPPLHPTPALLAWAYSRPCARWAKSAIWRSSFRSTDWRRLRGFGASGSAAPLVGFLLGPQEMCALKKAGPPCGTTETVGFLEMVPPSFVTSVQAGFLWCIDACRETILPKEAHLEPKMSCNPQSVPSTRQTHPMQSYGYQIYYRTASQVGRESPPCLRLRVPQLSFTKR